MSVKIYKPENRLAKTMPRPGAPTKGELTKAAETRVETLKPPIRSFVEAKVRTIVGQTTASDDQLFSECRALGDQARDVAEVAGAAGMEAIGEVCLGISAMVDGWTRQGIWRVDALRVHLHALTLVNQSTSEDNTKSVLERLKLMRRSIGIND